MRAGTRLRCALSTTEVIVVRMPADDIVIDCAGTTMVAADAEPEDSPGSGEPPGDAPMVLLGKRYEHADLGVEVLCTKAGIGPLTIDGAELVEKGAKPLPSSD